MPPANPMGKRPVAGNNVSHAHNKTRRRFLPNLHTKRIWVESEQRYVKLRVSQKGLRIIEIAVENDHQFIGSHGAPPSGPAEAELWTSQQGFNCNVAG